MLKRVHTSGEAVEARKRLKRHDSSKGKEGVAPLQNLDGNFQDFNDVSQPSLVDQSYGRSVRPRLTQNDRTKNLSVQDFWRAEEKANKRMTSPIS